jgi:LysM repeat protein
MNRTLLFAAFVSFIFSVGANASDSLRTETQNGKMVIVHKVEAGQTLYSIARKYGVSVNDIKALNPNMVQLKSDSEILIPSKNIATAPTSLPAKPLETTSTPVAPTAPSNTETELIHKVKQGETLYRISKLYNVSPTDIATLNQLGNAGIQLGQELKIPQSNAARGNDSSPAATAAKSPTTSTERKTSASGYPSITETGNGMHDGTMVDEPFYLALHKTAPIGTILFIKNKENGLYAHAKVSGKLSNASNAIVTVNKKVLDKLEAKNSNFPAEVSFTPED